MPFPNRIIKNELELVSNNIYGSKSSEDGFEMLQDIGEAKLINDALKKLGK